MSTVGTWVKFTKLEEKGMSTTNADLMHGKVVSFGDKVEIPINIGDKIVVSTVKCNQDLQNGVTYYYVSELQVMDILK
jgi:co-chaperonin GroES (HSP10)